MKTSFADWTKATLSVFFLLFCFYFGVASSVWQWRNPKANRFTCWTYFPDVIMFHKLEKFQ
jgi:hypothetical protein